MKTKLLILVTAAFLMIGCAATPKKTTYTELTQLPVSTKEYVIDDDGDTVKIIEKTTWEAKKNEITGTYENFAGESPKMNEMANMRLTNSQANNNDAIQRAVDKDDANLEVYEHIANPGNPNELRVIIKTDLGNGFSTMSSDPSVVYYGNKQVSRRAYDKALRLKQQGDPKRWDRIMELLRY